MELCDILQGLEYEIIQHGKKPLDIQGLTIDSRAAKEGFVFVCASAHTLDRHDYISSATENGATVVVVEKKDLPFPSDVTIVYVKSARGALNTLASNFYGNPVKRMRTIGVTGTKGKTSTTYFLETILQECGYSVGVIGTSGARFNGCQIDIPFLTATTPDTIELHAIFAEMAKRGANYVVMEVSSHSLALNKVGGIEFSAGIFTNLTQDHLDFHVTMENYLESKAKLFDQCAIGIINGDDPSSEFLKEYSGKRIKLFTFGLGIEIENDSHKSIDFLADNIYYSLEGVSFDLHFNGSLARFTLATPGRFSVYNALSAISTAISLKMPVDKIISGVSKITPVPGRLQMIPNNKGFRMIVDYAHSPESLKQIIETVREFTEGRVITVFGCGGDRDTTKRPIMGKIAGELSDFCIITSDNPRNEIPSEIICEIEAGIIPTECGYCKMTDRREAIFEAVSIARPGDSVIIAGKGYENYQEFENRRRIHFDDAEVAAEALDTIDLS